jgi:hypothetical protein
VDEALKEIGKGIISLANMLLVICFLNHILLSNISINIGIISLIIYGETIIYLFGFYLIKKGREMEKRDE